MSSISYDHVQSLKPSGLAEWLDGVLKENNLPGLSQEQHDSIVEQQVSGSSFLYLSETDLNELKFKLGQRAILMGKVIRPYKAHCQKSDGKQSGITVDSSNEDAELEGPSASKKPRLSNEEPKTKSGLQQCPISFCSYGFMATSGPDVSESALAAVTPGDKVWKGKPELFVYFIQDIPNSYVIDGRRVSRRVILDLANIWHERYDGIPKFVETESLEDSNIRVQFWKGVDADGRDIFQGNRTELGTDANKKPTEATMWLDLRTGGSTYLKHVVTHEFGHALGLGHEHQRPEFWDIAGKFLDTTKMYDDHRSKNSSLTRVAFEEQWGINREKGSGGDYDPDSMMHYWFKKEWLKDKYSRYQDLQVVEDDTSLSEEKRQVLRRIHNQNLALVPSVKDIEFFKTVYKDEKQTSCTILGPPVTAAENHGRTPKAKVMEKVAIIQDSDHFEVTQYLRRLPNEDLKSLGIALGLDTFKVQKMPTEGLLSNIVRAWFRKQDSVKKVLKSYYPYDEDLLTWNVLAAILELEDFGEKDTAAKIRKEKCTYNA